MSFLEFLLYLRSVKEIKKNEGGGRREEGGGRRAEGSRRGEEGERGDQMNG